MQRQRWSMVAMVAHFIVYATMRPSPPQDTTWSMVVAARLVLYRRLDAATIHPWCVVCLFKVLAQH